MEIWEKSDIGATMGERRFLIENWVKSDFGGNVRC